MNLREELHSLFVEYGVDGLVADDEIMERIEQWAVEMVGEDHELVPELEGSDSDPVRHYNGAKQEVRDRIKAATRIESIPQFRGTLEQLDNLTIKEDTHE